jgi:hypothetical protein
MVELGTKITKEEINEEEKEHEPRVDGEKIISIVVILGIAAIAITIGMTFYHTYQLREYAKTCSENPQLKYQVGDCTTIDDCVNKCAERLLKGEALQHPNAQPSYPGPSS